MAFSEGELRDMLGRLDNTQASITGLSKWILLHRAHMGSSVAEWLAAFKWELERGELKSLTNLLYVANDVIQTARRDGPAVGEQFAPALREAILRAMQGRAGRDEAFTARVKKMVRLWRDRSILSAGHLASLEKAYRGQGGGGAPGGSAAARVPGRAPDLAKASTSPSSSSSSTAALSAAAAAADSQVGAKQLSAVAALDKEVVDDSFVGELAQSDSEEAGAEPDVAQIVASSTSLGINQGLTEAQVALLAAMDVSEFEAISDEPLGERLDKVAYTLLAFEQQEGWATKEQNGAAAGGSKDKDKGDKADQYEAKLVSEKLTLQFATFATILEQCRARTEAAAARDSALTDMLVSEMDTSTDAMTELVALQSAGQALRKRVRPLARQLFLETNRRKRKRAEERRAKLMEELERERQAAQAAQEAEEARQAAEAARRAAANRAAADGQVTGHSALAAAFLSSVQRKPLTSSSSGGAGAAGVGGGGGGGGGVSLSLLDSLSKAFQAKGTTSQPTSLYGRDFGTSPPTAPPPALKQVYVYPDHNYPNLGGPPPSHPPPNGSYDESRYSKPFY